MISPHRKLKQHEIYRVSRVFVQVRKVSYTKILPYEESIKNTTKEIIFSRFPELSTISLDCQCLLTSGLVGCFSTSAFRLIRNEVSFNESKSKETVAFFRIWNVQMTMNLKRCHNVYFEYNFKSEHYCYKIKNICCEVMKCLYLSSSCWIILWIKQYFKIKFIDGKENPRRHMKW